MDDLIQMILAGGLYVTVIGTLGSGTYFFVTGAKTNQAATEANQAVAKANEAQAKMFESEDALNRTRVESAKIANRVANEMGRKLASVEGLGGFATGSSNYEGRGPCKCTSCVKKRGEGNV